MAMRYIDCMQQLLQRAKSREGEQLLSGLRKNVSRWMEHFSDDPTIESGWGHVYFCPKCGTFLTFDLENPHIHRCSCCGNIVTGAEYDASWVYLYRYDALMSAVQSAVLYRVDGERRYLDYFIKVIGFYGENWYRFCEHGRNTWPSGNGKITPQALNEAIFLVRVCGGLELLRDVLPQEWLTNISQWMLIPCAYFLDAQKRWIHNIPCWLNAAVAAVGLMTNNTDLIDRAFYRRYGFSDQVRGGGVTSSYFWYEGSIHYNFFTLEAFMNTLLFARIYNQEIPEDVEDTIYQMLLAPCKYAFSCGQLPNPNDGWPNLGLKTYSFIYEMGAKIFSQRKGGEEIAALAQVIREMPYTRVPVPLSYPTYVGDVSLEWLLFGQPAKEETIKCLPYFKGSHLFEASNFATLRYGAIELFHKFGHCTPSHAHPDKMTIEVRAFGERITHDLSNCGYAAKLCPEFHRTTVSHNTVVMDGRNHPGVDPGTVLHYGQDHLYTKAQSAYEGIDFLRKIVLTQDGFSDVFSVENKAEEKECHTFDWVFHLDGTLMEPVDGQPDELGYVQAGYAYLTNVQRVTQTGTITLTWQFSGGVVGIQTIETSGKILYIAKSPDNPPAQDGSGRTTLLLRSREVSPTFVQNWRFYRK